jgi:hypothetical protein
MAENSDEAVPRREGAIARANQQFYALRVHKFTIGVVGASGYAGWEQCELVARHPRARLAFATASDRLGNVTGLTYKEAWIPQTL